MLLFACGASKYSNKRKGEVINASVKENSEVINYALFQQQEIPALADRGQSRGLAVGQVLSFAGKGVMALINMERKKYTATYEQSLTDLVFYDQLSDKSAFDPVGMQFNGFEVLRMVQTSRNTVDTAFYASFEPDLSNPYEIINNSFFRLKVKDIKLDYAKAKVADSRWYLPWSWGGKKKRNKLNLDLEIVFRATWVTSDGNYYDNVEIGRFLLTLRDIPLNQKDPARQKYFDDLKGTLLTGRCTLVPRSFGYYYFSGNQLQPCYGQGNYTIEAGIKESGTQNFVLKMTNKVQTFVKENR
jgi:hypothetical protein